MEFESLKSELEEIGEMDNLGVSSFYFIFNPIFVTEIGKIKSISFYRTIAKRILTLFHRLFTIVPILETVFMKIFIQSMKILKYILLYLPTLIMIMIRL